MFAGEFFACGSTSQADIHHITHERNECVKCGADLKLRTREHTNGYTVREREACKLVALFQVSDSHGKKSMREDCED